MDLDPEDFEALGYGDSFTQLAYSGWAERAEASARAYKKTYEQSPACKRQRSAYKKRPERKAAALAYQRSYLKTPAGKASMERAAAKRKTPEGRKAGAANSARYRARLAAEKAAIK